MNADHAVVRYSDRIIRIGVITAKRWEAEHKIVPDPDVPAYVAPGLTIYYYLGV